MNQNNQTNQSSFSNIVMSRYATKKFDGKKVPEEKINELLELARFAPSSFNLQPWRIKIITDEQTKEKLRAVSYNQEQITTASHVFVICTEANIHTILDEVLASMKENNVPSQSIEGFSKMVKGFIDATPKEYHLPWMQRQVYLAASNILNGAKSLGFDSCPMEGFDPKGVSEVLQLPSHIVPTVIIPVGYASDTARPKVRLSQKNILV